MKQLLLSIFLSLFAATVWAQSGYEISGTLIDAKTQKPLANATATILNTNLSASTDAMGHFSIAHAVDGQQRIQFVYTGYTVKTMSIEIEKNQSLDLGTIGLEEDITSEIQTSLITLTESDLGDDNSGSESTAGLLQASRDAFQQAAAFNWGQARFRVRGLDNEYGNVFINGVSMNKIIDGRPQFSNWGGLNDATRNQEFTTGSRPSDFTGTGILGTQSIDMRATAVRAGTRLSVSGGNTNYNWRTMATYGSGLTKNGWAYAASASYRGAKEGFFEGTDYDAKSFFLAVEKRVNDKHSLNLSAIYGQNSRGKNSPNSQEVIDLMGYKYNSYWGWQDGKKRNSREKDVEEPLFILSHYWNINQKTTLNTNVSYQFGTIKNTRLEYNGANNPDPTYYKNLPSYYLNFFNTKGDTPIWTPDYVNAERNRVDFMKNPQINWADMYGTNTRLGRSLYALYADVVADQQLTANTYLTTQLSNRVGFNAGVTYRNLKSENYKEMLDLLGGAYKNDTDEFYVGSFSQADLNQPNRKVYEGDRYGYNYILRANVIDAFTQFKFNYNKLDFYLTQNASFTDYEREGLYRNGLYADNSFGKSDKVTFSNFGAKGGLTYRYSGKHIFDANVAYYTQAPSMRNVYSNARLNDGVTLDLTDEKILAGDVSYLIRTPKLKGRVTGYYNKVKDATKVGFFYAEGLGFEDADKSNDFVSEITRGLDKESFGLELGLEYQLTKTIKATAAVGMSQSVYTNNGQVALNVDGRKTLGLNPIVDFGESYIKNYHVAGMPQNAYSLGIEYRDPKYWWIGANANLLTDLYVDISPILRTNNFFAQPGQSGAAFTNIDETTARRLLKQEKLDDIFLVNVQGGKSWRYKGKTVGFFASVNNVLGLEYKTGGFEQARNANYSELLMDNTSGTPSFGPKYFHGYGRTYFLNLYINF